MSCALGQTTTFFLIFLLEAEKNSTHIVEKTQLKRPLRSFEEVIRTCRIGLLTIVNIVCHVLKKVTNYVKKLRLDKILKHA